MTVPPMSYTALATFENCSRKYYEIYIAKSTKREETPQMAYGTQVHTAFERRLGGGHQLPDELRGNEPLAVAIEQAGALAGVEMQLAIDADGRAADFWGKPFLRGKADVVVHKGPAIVIVDWKTGKPREDETELKLFALMLAPLYPQVKVFKGVYVWLKEGKIGKLHDVSDTARTLETVQRVHAQIADRMASGIWEEWKNPLCGWCPVFQCRFNTQRK